MKKNQKHEYSLAELVAGLDVVIQGDENCLIHGMGTIHQAKPGQMTFLINPVYKKFLPTTEASAVIVLPSDSKDCPTNALISRDPYYTYAKIASYFQDASLIEQGIHSTAVIGKECEIDPSASIGAHCVLGNGVNIGANVNVFPGCVIGDSSIIDEQSCLHANVTVYSHVRIGKRVIIASGAVIGSDGFGLAKHKGTWHKVPQLGSVIIEDDVEIGANCTIDRGAIDDTIIKKGAKLDNIIQIGHNVQIGENTAIAALVGVSGSTTIGNNCMIAGQAGFAGHLTIGDNTVVTGAAAITRSLRDPGVYSSGVGGVVTNQEWRKKSARINRLDKLVERVKILETLLSALTERQGT